MVWWIRCGRQESTTEDLPLRIAFGGLVPLKMSPCIHTLDPIRSLSALDGIHTYTVGSVYGLQAIVGAARQAYGFASSTAGMMANRAERAKYACWGCSAATNGTAANRGMGLGIPSQTHACYHAPGRWKWHDILWSEPGQFFDVLLVLERLIAVVSNNISKQDEGMDHESSPRQRIL